GTAIVELTVAPTGLSPYAAETVTYRPGEVAALAAAVVGSGAVTGEVAGVPAGTIEAVRAHIARAREKSGPDGPSAVAILGPASLAEPEDQVATAARILADLPGVAFLSALRRANVHGALDMGLAPGLLPGRVTLDGGRDWFTRAWGAVPAARGGDAEDILLAAAGDQAHGPRVRSLIVLGADPLGDFPDRRLAQRALGGAEFVVAVA